jgi:hypothetical protein
MARKGRGGKVEAEKKETLKPTQFRLSKTDLEKLATIQKKYNLRTKTDALRLAIGKAFKV